MKGGSYAEVAVNPSGDHLGRLIALSSGQFALVDASDFDRVNRNKWHARKVHGRWIGGRHARGKIISLHRFVVRASPFVVVLPLDGNYLNCRRENLCCATHTEFQRSMPRADRWKGITWLSDRKMWRAQIKVNGRYIFLGYFASDADAAAAYNLAAAEHFGEFAAYNVFSNGKRQCVSGAYPACPQVG